LLVALKIIKFTHFIVVSEVFKKVCISLALAELVKGFTSYKKCLTKTFEMGKRGENLLCLPSLFPYCVLVNVVLVEAGRKHGFSLLTDIQQVSPANCYHWQQPEAISEEQVNNSHIIVDNRK